MCVRGQAREASLQRGVAARVHPRFLPTRTRADEEEQEVGQQLGQAASAVRGDESRMVVDVERRSCGQQQEQQSLLLRPMWMQVILGEQGAHFPGPPASQLLFFAFGTSAQGMDQSPWLLVGFTHTANPLPPPSADVQGFKRCLVR